MKTEDLGRFQVMLEHMRAETLESLGRVQQEGRSMGEASRGDMGECSVTNFSREFAFQQSTRKRHALRNIEAAVNRIKEGTFGRCMSCGGDILTARLRAMPFSAYCRACQEKFEREQSVERDAGSHIPKAPAEGARPVRSISKSDSSSKSDTA